MAEEQEIEEGLFNIDEEDIEKLSQETFHLTDISSFFPELVWKQIVNKLNATNDIESCSNSSTYFRSLLMKKREPQIVLQVFELLCLYLIEDEQSEDEQDEDEQDEDEPDEDDVAENNVPEPQIVVADIDNAVRGLKIHEAVVIDNPNIGNANHEPAVEIQNDGDNINLQNQEQKDDLVKELLKFRLVSKSWNYAIEALFPHKETGHYTLKFDMSNFKYEQLDPYCNDTFISFQPPQEFIERFDPTHYNFKENKPLKNPFLARKVQFMEVQIYHQMEDEQWFYLDGIFEILKKYGSEIWYVCFDFQIGLFDNDHFVMYERLEAFLTLLPNLKVLRVEYHSIVDACPPNRNLLRRDVLRNLINEEIGAAVQQNPLPLLPHLEFISSSNLPTPIFNELIDKNQHIVYLQVFRKVYHGDYNLFAFNLPNLSVLNLNIKSVEQLESFEKYPFPRPLEKVYLWYEKSTPFVPWSRIFHDLESKLTDNCTELLIQMPLPKTEEEKNQVLEESHVCRLNLPKLERITFFDDTPFCLDFLLPSKYALKEILLRYSNDDNESAVAQHLENQKFVGCRQNIQFVGFKDELEHSNIWLEFPKLMELSVHRSSEMGECLTYTAAYWENKGIILQRISKHVWSRETGQNID